MDDAELISSLECCTLAESAFGHANHVRVGYLYLRRFEFSQAISLMAKALRAYAAAHGKEGLYHETITVAFIALINERLTRGGDQGGWAAFAAANADLLDKNILSRYYRPETLQSPIARKVFILDERSPSPCDAGGGIREPHS